MDYKEKIKELPLTPGVYIMKDEKGMVLYVGKAGNLKKRVSSYFYAKRVLPERTRAMTARVSDITYIPSATEAEALIYENSLIKQLSPKYNVALRDDKSYPMLKLTAGEKFPRLFITRQRKEDGALYYGPYTDVKLLRGALIILRQMFPLRSCDKMPKKVCLDYHIKQCIGPCIGEVDEAGYAGMVAELKLFLKGDTKELSKLLSDKMLEASKGEEFEKAADIKRRIEAISAVRENKIHYGPTDELEELKRILGLGAAPEAIEAFDVSNIMGKEAVGSMIYFYKGRPRKSEYRKFRIKTISAIDDYAMMREIVRRRYSRLVREKLMLPDLVIIDGGKGHLRAGIDELDKAGAGHIPAIGIAKQFEHIYVKGSAEPVILPKESKALHLLKRIRDEAHRFAISYHKSLRGKIIALSELDGIKGIGKKRKRALMKCFGTMDRIKSASLEELLKVGEMSEKAAHNVIGYFKKQ